MKKNNIPKIMLLGALALGGLSVVTSCDQIPATEVKMGTVSMTNDGVYDGGRISLSHSGEVKVGTTVTVTVTPETDYTLDTLTVNGRDIKEAKSFDVVEGNNVVAASFRASVPSQDIAYPPFTKGLAEGARTRNYDSKYDLMLEDFSGEKPNGTLTEGMEITDSFLTVAIDNIDTENFPGNDDRSIYKQARSSQDIHTYDEIVFKMRCVAGSVKTENLVLGLRGDDSLKVFPLSLADAVDNDGNPTDADLTSEWKEVKVSILQSLEEDDYYDKTDGTASETKVMDKVIGFHLYATGEVQGVVEISEINGVKGTETISFEDFNHELTNDNHDKLTWWKDSTGYITTRSLLGSSGSYAITSDKFKDYENVVVRMLGENPTDWVLKYETSAGVMGSIGQDGLKDDENNTIVELSNGCYGSYIINLENSGIDAETLTSLTIEATTTKISVNQIFLTNLGEDEAGALPKIDTTNKTMYSDFNFEHGAFSSDWDVASTDPVFIENGISAGLSYANGDMLSVDGKALVFDATNLPSDGYINCKMATAGVTSGYNDYLVLSVKVTDGATLDNFRLTLNENGSGVVYVNQMVSDTGIPTTMLNDSEYPYVTSDGYTLLVVDIAKSGLNLSSEFIDMYYSGTGKLLIDEIYLTNRAIEYSDYFVQEKAYDVSGYAYVGGYDLKADEKYLELTVSADVEGLNLLSIRIEAGSTLWIKDGVIYNTKGQVVDHTVAIPTNGEYKVIIDLEKSGFTLGAGNPLHIHAGDMGETGNLTISARVGKNTTKDYKDLI